MNKRESHKKAREELLEAYASRKEAIRARLWDFSRIQPEHYFYELVYCLLTPQTSAIHADTVVQQLQVNRFQIEPFDPEPLLRNPAQYIRFHHTKSKHLLELKSKYPDVVAALNGEDSAFELREWLVRNVKGLGYKEASHFLRNIGKNEGLAILDRHILRNLHRLGVLRSLPDTLSRKKYYSIEKKFRKFAEEIQIPLDELDLLFWSQETGEIRK